MYILYTNDADSLIVNTIDISGNISTKANGILHRFIYQIQHTQIAQLNNISTTTKLQVLWYI